MRRRRLRDGIEVRNNSAFASFLAIFLVLLGFLAAVSTLTERKFFEVSTMFGCGCPPYWNVDDLILTTSNDGKYYWNTEGPLPIEEFEDRFRHWKLHAKKPAVMVAADETARWADAVNLLELVRRNGFTGVQFEPRVRARPVASR